MNQHDKAAAKSRTFTIAAYSVAEKQIAAANHGEVLRQVEREYGDKSKQQKLLRIAIAEQDPDGFPGVTLSKDYDGSGANLTRRSSKIKFTENQDEYIVEFYDEGLLVGEFKIASKPTKLTEFLPQITNAWRDGLIG